ncbi:MAG: acetoin utilization protein AcuC [Pseudomonadota bacterium]
MGQPAVFIGSEIYRNSTYGVWHPLRVPRVSTVMDLSRAMGWLPPDQFVQSPRAKPKALHLWHEPEYIEALQRAEKLQYVSQGERERFQLGTPANPVFTEMFRRPATAAGGSLLAGELLRNPGVVYNPAGGTHHGMPGRANGFCYLNDPVLAMLSLRRQGVRRLVYIDIDAHHPDGVEYAFRGDPDVLIISVHEAGLWPRTGLLEDRAGGSAFNLPVPRGLNDSEMAQIRDRLIVPLAQGFEADALVLQCGADGLEEDPQAHLSLSNTAHWNVLRAVSGLCERLLVLGGGGYNPWSVGRMWTGIWGILNDHDIPDSLPSEAEDVLRALRFEGNRRGRNPPDHWFTTLRDVPRPGPVRAEILRDIDRLLSRR